MSSSSVDENEVGESQNETEDSEESTFCEESTLCEESNSNSDCQIVENENNGGAVGVTTTRRSERIANKKCVSNWLSYCAELSEDEPNSIEEALASKEKCKWQEAINSEFSSIEENLTWIVVEKPEKCNLIKTKWVFKKKKEHDDTIRYKARLVVKGYTQRKGIDYEETFSPVVRYTSIRYLMALAARYNLKIEQMDAVTAFLQGDLVENVYVEPPSVVKVPEGHVLKLKKVLYGLKQASHVWNKKLNEALQKYGMKRSELDPCIYYRIEGKRMTFMALYVDDMLLFTNDDDFCKLFKSKLMNEFKMKFLGEAKRCLGMRINKTKEFISLDQ